MTIDKNNQKHLIADEGKEFKQISSGIIMGTEIWLRKVRINNELIDDFIDNYEEIDIPEEDFGESEEQKERGL